MSFLECYLLITELLIVCKAIYSYFATFPAKERKSCNISQGIVSETFHLTKINELV